jgi:hypothetical protein
MHRGGPDSGADVTRRGSRAILRSIATGFALLCGGLLAGLLLSEAAYRLARTVVCVGGSPGVAAEPRSFGWTHHPGGSGRAYACFEHRFEWQSDVKINAHGLHEREIDYAKPAGVRRVLLLGDSMTEAIQVAPERSFARLVENALRADGVPAQVINAGHAGFGTDNELLFYRAEGRRYDPDLVVQVLDLQNDVFENYPPLYQRAYARADVQWPPKPSFSIGPDGALVEHPAPPAPPAEVLGGVWERVGRFVSSNLFVVRSVQRALHGAPTAAHPGPRYPLNFDLYAPEDESWQRAWALTVRLTEELRATVERDGHRFAVIVLPSREMVVGPAVFDVALGMLGVDAKRFDLERPHGRTLELLRAADVPFLDLFPALAADAASGGHAFFAWDVHLTEHGHATIAPAITDFVRKRLEDSYVSPTSP